ncbi:MAG: hypothetical protein AB4290_31620 [Spirulina sp.]
MSHFNEQLSIINYQLSITNYQLPITKIKEKRRLGVLPCFDPKRLLSLFPHT